MLPTTTIAAFECSFASGCPARPAVWPSPGPHPSNETQYSLSILHAFHHACTIYHVCGETQIHSLESEPRARLTHLEEQAKVRKFKGTQHQPASERREDKALIKAESARPRLRGQLRRRRSKCNIQALNLAATCRTHRHSCWTPAAPCAGARKNNKARRWRPDMRPRSSQQ